MEISAIMSGDDQIVDEGCRCDETIFDGHRFAPTSETLQEAPPIVNSQRIRGFRFNRHKKSFFRTRQQPINKALIRSRFTTYQPVFTTIDPFYFELLTRRDLVLLA